MLWSRAESRLLERQHNIQRMLCWRSKSELTARVYINSSCELGKILPKHNIINCLCRLRCRRLVMRRWQPVWRDLGQHHELQRLVMLSKIGSNVQKHVATYHKHTTTVCKLCIVYMMCTSCAHHIHYSRFLIFAAPFSRPFWLCSNYVLSVARRAAP